MFNLGFPELIMILVVALIVLGPGKLPEAGRSVGRALREFKKASTEVQSEFRQELLDQDKENQKAEQESTRL